MAEDPTIMTEEWPPYNYTVNGEPKGFSVEIVQAIMKELKINTTILFYTGARGEKYLQKKSNHMLFSLFRTPERDKIYKWIGPISEESVFFFKKKGNSLIVTCLEDAKRVKRIGTRHEGMIYNFLKGNGFQNLCTQSEPSALIKYFLNGKYDLIANTPITIKYRLEMINSPLDALEQTPVKCFSFPLYIACSKDMPDPIIQKWQDILVKIKVSGKYKQIYNDYFKE